MRTSTPRSRNAGRAAAGERGRGLRPWLGAFAAIVIAMASAGCASDPSESEPQPAHDRGETLLARGVRGYQAGDYSAAATDFTNALHYYRRYDLAAGMVRSRINLARIELALARPDDAAAHIEAAQELADRLDAPTLRRRLDLVTSNVALALGDTERAATVIEAHLAAFGDDQTPIADDAGGLGATRASLIANRATVAFERASDDTDLWLQRLQRALAKLADVPPGLEAQLHSLRARQAQTRQDPDAALEWLERARRAYKLARSEPGIATSLERSAAIHARMGHAGQARRHLDRALYSRIAVRDRRGARANLEQRLRLARDDSRAPTQGELRAWIERLDAASVDWAGLRRAVIDADASDR